MCVKRRYKGKEENTSTRNARGLSPCKEMKLYIQIMNFLPSNKKKLPDLEESYELYLKVD